MYNPVTKRLEIKVHGFRNFMKALDNAIKEGYTLEEGVYPMPMGARYYCELYKASELPEKEVKAVISEDKESEEGEETPVVFSPTAIPDWEVVNKMVKKGDKEALEVYARKFGVELSRRRSAANMYKDFKDALGA